MVRDVNIKTINFEGVLQSFCELNLPKNEKYKIENVIGFKNSLNFNHLKQFVNPLVDFPILQETEDLSITF